MLAVSPLRNNNNNTNNERENQMEGRDHHDEFSDFAGNFLDSIDFDDLFINISDEHDNVLPDLEMDPEILAGFSITTSNEEADSGFNNTSPVLSLDEDTHNLNDISTVNDDQKLGEVGSPPGSGHPNQGAEIIGSKREVESKINTTCTTNNSKDSDKGRKSMAPSNKNPSGKKKVKVDWTPELHRRFVQAVEQLGVDKAVPSRILELMGIDCLTRHNIASHLQKYRSHRKHLLAREAEAANWSHRRQMYGGGGKRDVNQAWIAPPPTMGFPPPPPATPMPTHFRPLHVWGHPPPPMEHLHMWPKHPPHAWPAAPPPQSPHHRPPPPSLDPSFWVSQHQPRFPSSPVPGIPPALPAQATMYRPPEPTGPILQEVHPSKESVDEAIGHVLSKPWMPLPLGLKPPSVESVMSALQRQGISKIPPAAAAANCVQ